MDIIGLVTVNSDAERGDNIDKDEEVDMFEFVENIHSSCLFGFY